ncbi:uncharacterized protein LOC108851191 [Raphanus sativus]|uniref:Uncharacterized protein LOC108851191 n=1 Tax=Raphanus sativus TaxID=3726 RepID=A0A9W3DL37_RAPSA|nr:uncharacterized protein LOC108851191 [Raphanus sativus]
MPPKRIYLSGAQKRQRKEKADALTRSMQGSMDRFLVQQPANLNESDRGNDDFDDPMEDEKEINDEDVNEEEKKNEDNVDVDIDGDENLSEKENYDVNDQDNTDIGRILDIYDPGHWGEVKPGLRLVMVEKGPAERLPSDFVFPREKASGRHFSHAYYIRSLSNGKKQDRRWLVYSKTLDKLFCFCCKLFTRDNNPSHMASRGFNDWKNILERLRYHETSHEHIKCMSQWMELELRLQKNQTIDKHIQEELSRERNHWKDVMVRIFSLVKTLAKQNLALRGGNEKLKVDGNGNFLSFIDSMAEWDPVMREHVRRFEDGESRYHYLSNRIQNELIATMADEIKGMIIKKLRSAKFFSVIVDCTPDISHHEQMTLILRCVDVSTASAKIEEFFLTFLIVNDTSGEGLFREIQNVLVSLDLDIDDVRGQGYDNGSNMKGKHKGVQKRFLDVNPRAFYTPCGCHSLNLALCDMASTSDKAISFFGIIQRIYNVFASSTKRWKILEDKVGGLTVKSLSQTRWESHVNCVKAIRFQAPKIRDALIYIAETTDDPSTQSTAECLVTSETHGIGNYEFLLSMVIWYKLLFAVNTVSKSLQSKDMNIEVAVSQLKGLVSFFRSYRETGFESAKSDVKQIAEAMEIEAMFPAKKKRVIKRKKFFDEEPELDDESIDLSPEDSFRISYFLQVMDRALCSLETRFEQFQKYEQTFGFLFDLDKLKSASEDSLMVSCTNLEAALKHGNHSDVIGDDLCFELMVLKGVLPQDYKRPLDVLNFLKGREECYPNSWIAYQILLMIPVSVATAERNFSKLKLIKSYLRSTMSQERLNGLAVISIERDLLRNLDYETLVKEFIEKEGRKIMS